MSELSCLFAKRHLNGFTSEGLPPMKLNDKKLLNHNTSYPIFRNFSKVLFYLARDKDRNRTKEWASCCFFLDDPFADTRIISFMCMRSLSCLLVVTRIHVSRWVRSFCLESNCFFLSFFLFFKEKKKR